MLSFFAQAALRRNDGPRARFLLEEGLKHHQQIEDQYGIAQAYALLSQAAALEQDYLAARALATQSLRIAHVIDDKESPVICLEGLADVLANQGEIAWAVQLWAAAEGVGRSEERRVGE